MHKLNTITAGATRRTIAFLIDILILAVLAHVLGRIFFDTFARMGMLTSHLVSLALVVCYFAIPESKICRGKTIGKWLLKIRLVGKDGQPLACWKALLRSVIFWLPFLVMRLSLPADSSRWAAYLFMTVILLILCGLSAAILYFFICNNRTDQSLHDVIVGGYVVQHPITSDVIMTRIWPWHYLFVCIVGLCACVLGSFLFLMMYHVGMQLNAPLIKMMEADTALKTVNVEMRQLPAVQNLVVSMINIEAKKGKPKVFLVSAKITQKPLQTTIETLARTILGHYPQSAHFDRIKIVGYYGYDIGFSSAAMAEIADHTPAEWKERLS